MRPREFVLLAWEMGLCSQHAELRVDRDLYIRRAEASAELVIIFHTLMGETSSVSCQGSSHAIATARNEKQDAAKEYLSVQDSEHQIANIAFTETKRHYLA